MTSKYVEDEEAEPSNAKCPRTVDSPDYTSEEGRRRIPRLLTVPEVAEATGLSVPRLYLLIRTRRLPAVRVGRQVRVAEDQLVAWIEAGGESL